MCLFFREEGRAGEREAEKHQHERETSIGCLLHAPCLEIEPAPQASATQVCALTRNQASDTLLCEMMPNQLSLTSQGKSETF